MNKIFLEKIEKAWIDMEGFFSKSKRKKALFIFAKLSDNFLLNPVGNCKKKIKKIKIVAISESAVFTQSKFRIEISKDQYEYFIEIISAEENINVKLLNKKEEAALNEKIPLEQVLASKVIDCNFENLLEQKEYDIVNFDIEDEYQEFKVLEKEIIKQVSGKNFIPSNKILLNIIKQTAKIEKTDYRIIAEYISKKENKNLLYKNYDIVCSTKDLQQSRDRDLNQVIFDMNRYDTFYILIDYVEVNGNYFIKGLYKKSELLMNKMIYIKLKNLHKFVTDYACTLTEEDSLLKKIKFSLDQNKIEIF
tara:strand:+ start:14999 stop:15916 length:918 start_codon:yes stop_codon:yes gene_type:complete